MLIAKSVPRSRDVPRSGDAVKISSPNRGDVLESGYSTVCPLI